MDCLSMLMLLCADFPLNVVRSAFKPAAFISKGGRPQQLTCTVCVCVCRPLAHERERGGPCTCMLHLRQLSFIWFVWTGVSTLDNPEMKVPLQTFLDSLAVTFMYERFLVEMRHEAFESKSKQCQEPPPPSNTHTLTLTHSAHPPWRSVSLLLGPWPSCRGSLSTPPPPGWFPPSFSHPHSLSLPPTPPLSLPPPTPPLSLSLSLSLRCHPPACNFVPPCQWECSVILLCPKAQASAVLVRSVRGS